MHIAKIDPLEHECEIPRVDFHMASSSRWRERDPERAKLQALVHKYKPRAIPHQQLDPVATTVQKGEHVTAQRILQDDRPRRRSQAIKAAT